MASHASDLVTLQKTSTTKADNILARLNDKNLFGDTMDLLVMFRALELVSRVPGGETVINLMNLGSVDTGLHRDGNKIIQGFNLVLGMSQDEVGLPLRDAAAVKGFREIFERGETCGVSPVRHREEGMKVQKLLWDETVTVFRNYLPESSLRELLGL
ncbi:hypothetical protein DL95DRAFT_499468 [Leptodontidium sp. 2 PMI_412]|nr:hypothetical protein DL95DRAFT_499468 [Leptodontidium sp. 2 PMI_412]